jgi:acyl-coenzyme A synthetase/AMP-(fatty) acid ligase
MCGVERVPGRGEVSAATGHSPGHVVVGETGGDTQLAEILDRKQQADPVTRAAGDVSELIFTSGTEAEPKAILHSEQTANFSVRVA